jgi:hypothetical protein
MAADPSVTDLERILMTRAPGDLLRTPFLLEQFADTWPLFGCDPGPAACLLSSGTRQVVRHSGPTTLSITVTV